MKKSLVLAVTAAALAAAGAVAIPTTAATSVNVDDDVFSPGSVTVSKGTTVKWRWKGDDLHDVTVSKGPKKFKSSRKRSGTFSKKLKKKGTYKIVCTVHPGMDMTVKVK